MSPRYIIFGTFKYIELNQVTLERVNKIGREMNPNASEYARVKMKVGNEEDQKKHQEGVASEARENKAKQQ